MLESIAEERGYDRGFTAGTKHAHDLLDQHLTTLKHKRKVMEEECYKYDVLYRLEYEIKLLQDMKLLIRTGHYDG